MNARKTIDFLGIPIDMLDTESLRERIDEFISTGKHKKVMYVNADCMLKTFKNLIYRKVLKRADLVYADGTGVVWGARLWNYHLPKRSTAADFMQDFCVSFAKKKYRLYLLGAQRGIAEKAAGILVEKIQDLQIVGVRHGYFEKEEQEGIIQEINNAKPHILLVGFGAPSQELWIDRNNSKLDVPVIWGVGGLFDFLSGRLWRGPSLLLDHGFEWLCRLIAEPGRLWQRYLIGNARFVLHLLWYRITGTRP